MQPVCFETLDVLQELRVPFWVWLKIKQLGLRRCWSTFPLTRVPFWYPFLEPHPFVLGVGTRLVRDSRQVSYDAWGAGNDEWMPKDSEAPESGGFGRRESDCFGRLRGVGNVLGVF